MSKKNRLKKLVSYVLVGAFTIGCFSSLHRGKIEKVEAAPNHTQSEAIAWASARGNENWCVDVDGSYGCQCVDLIMAYYNYLVGYHVSGNAKDYGSNSLPSGWTRVYSNPQAGDVIVWGAGALLADGNYRADSTYGHVGIITSVVNGSKVNTVETNTYEGGQPAHHFQRYSSTAMCFIRPNWNNNKEPIGSFDSVSSGNGTIRVAGWAFDPDTSSKSISVHVYIGGPAGSSGAECHGVGANLSRSDVNSAYSITGNHGFDTTITTNKTGQQDVYIYAIDSNNGTNPLIGKKTVTIKKDTSPPVISDVEVKSISDNKYLIYFSATDTESEVNNISFRVEYNAFQSYHTYGNGYPYITPLGAPYYSQTTDMGGGTKRYGGYFDLDDFKEGAYVGSYRIFMTATSFGGTTTDEYVYTVVDPRDETKPQIIRFRYGGYDFNSYNNLEYSLKCTDKNDYAKTHPKVIIDVNDENLIKYVYSKVWYDGEPSDYVKEEYNLALRDQLTSYDKEKSVAGSANMVSAWREYSSLVPKDKTSIHYKVYAMDSSRNELQSEEYIVNFEYTHSYDEGVVLKEPGCKTAGTIKYTCKDCGEEKIEDIPPKGHSWTLIETKDATCTSTGKKVYVCDNCGDSKTDIIPMKEHSWDSGTITKEATYDETGIKHFKCKNCSAEKNEIIPKKEKSESGDGNKSDNKSDDKSSGNDLKDKSNNKSKYSNEWVDGKWYDADGSQTYKGTLSWKSNSTGWWVEDSAGWYPTNSWQKIDGVWYYFKPDGYMASNEYYNGYWFNRDGSWDSQYKLSWKSNSKGWWVEDISGWWPSSTWLKIDGYWYYFNASGYMVTNQYVDGWWIGADGVCY